MTQFPIHPAHPERICWGCEKFCPADDMCCGNGTIRAPHPVELLGEDWWEWSNRRESEKATEDDPAGLKPALQLAGDPAAQEIEG